MHTNCLLHIEGKKHMLPLQEGTYNLRSRKCILSLVHDRHCLIISKHFISGQVYSLLIYLRTQPIPNVVPSDMFIESESESEVTQSCPTFCDPVDCIAHQAPLSMGFSKQEYWSGLPFPSPGDLPDPGIELGSPELQADTLTSEPPGKPHVHWGHSKKGPDLGLLFPVS